jgi:serine/threonine protein kinase
MSFKQIGPYQIIRPIGHGGMGEVLLGHDDRLDRQAAIKVLPDDSNKDRFDTQRRQRFLQEARSVSAIAHPNVCVIYDIGETSEGQPFIAMEYIEGNTLCEINSTGPLTIELTIELSAQIADALQVAHEAGVVHRDIKPANVIITPRGQAKVLDFGLAKRVDESSEATQKQLVKTHDGQILGTPSYMSPEQVMGQPVDGRSDIFSLGVVMYELITGRKPFTGRTLGETLQKICRDKPENMAKYNPRLPQELAQITLKCLQQDPAQRYQNAGEVVTDLKNLAGVLSGKEIETIPAAPVQAMTQIVQRNADSKLLSADDIRQSDILISCSQIDNQPLAGKGEGWISRFHRNLKIRMEQLTGERMKVSFCEMPVGCEEVDETVLNAIPGADTMVAIVSPPFARSNACIDGTARYWSKKNDHSSSAANARSLFKVVKTPVADKDLQPQMAQIFQQLLSYDFFDQDPETKRVREFDESYGESAAQRYYEMIYDLAYEIADTVQKTQRPDTASSGTISQQRKSIYLAEATSDLRDERENLRREFLEQGHFVYPDRSLPIELEELESAVQGCLDKCDVIIQLIGSRYGFTPEGADESVVVIQNRMARDAAESHQTPRFLWLSPESDTEDARQQEFVESLRQEPATSRGVEVVRESIENFKELLEQRWQAELLRQQQTAEGDKAGPSTENSSVYLVFEERDEALAEPIEDFLYEQGIEVMLPEFQGDEHEIHSLHIQNLTDCDGVVVLYGSSSKSWVDIKVRELIKALGYRGGRPIVKACVVVAPPIDRRKERFRSLTADVFQPIGDTLDSSVLTGFCQELKDSYSSTSPGDSVARD